MYARDGSKKPAVPRRTRAFGTQPQWGSCQKEDSDLRFLGNIEGKLDGKGRVFLPSVFRKVLSSAGEERLILRMDVFQSCLTLYPESVWNAQVDTLRRSLNRYNASHQQIFRQFVADAEEVVLDGNGRFLISRRNLQKAHIDQAVRFIGMDDTIEIWSADAVESPFMEAEEFGKALQELMKDGGALPF